MDRWLVTGGCGFIGSHFIRFLLKNFTDIEVVNLDCYTYAADERNLGDLQAYPNFRVIPGNIASPQNVAYAFRDTLFDYVVNFAAESHVDRSITSSAEFIRTNIQGVGVLLDACLAQVKEGWHPTFLQVSTDEVYGDIPLSAYPSVESDSLHPRSPYSASKAAAEHLVNAYHETHQLRTVITRGSNTYGSNQYPEKLIPLAVTRALMGKKIPVYGDGLQERQWIAVQDHVKGIHAAALHGEGTWNIGGPASLTNKRLLESILFIMDLDPEYYLEYVTDRKGHDRRYAINSCAAAETLGWGPTIALHEGLVDTVGWYTEHLDRYSQLVSV